MKKELEEQIVAIAPYMFRYEGWDDPMRALLLFGFECNNGWFNIIKSLVIEIKEKDIKQTTKIFQVKEKYGTLRFYADGTTEEIDNLITKAENLTEVTCEVCGKKGSIRGRAWIQTLCDACFKKGKNNAY